jgi:putative endonuclease
MLRWSLFKSSTVEKPKSLGQLGEEWAQEEYRKRGYKIIAKNEYNKKGKQLGEIDFIARKGSVLAFVEVKTRTAGVDRYGKGVESVNQFKQIKILKAVKLYLSKHPELLQLQPRIDVCGIEVENVDKKQYSAIILENAVEDWN